MEIMTRDFGKIEINQDDIIEFPQAVPGFPEEKEFVLFPIGEESPFIVLQSVNNSDLAFITIEPGNYLKGYEFEISDELANKLKIKSNEDLLVISIATIKDEIENMTINLAAPVIINLKEKLGKQVILDKEDYPVKYRLFADKEKELVE